MSSGPSEAEQVRLMLTRAFHEGWVSVGDGGRIEPSPFVTPEHPAYGRIVQFAGELEGFRLRGWLRYTLAPSELDALRQLLRCGALQMDQPGRCSLTGEAAEHVGLRCLVLDLNQALLYWQRSTGELVVTIEGLGSWIGQAIAWWHKACGA
ncbi:MAG: hypothetical protein ACYC5O_00585 [Anaerolineae bacterium]